MSKYRHTESGVEIISESELSGDWELIETEDEPKKKSKSKKVETEEE